MYLSPEDARSDVILAGAAAVFGGTLLSLLLTAPGIPTSGVFAEVIVVVAAFALSGLVPFLLARYRADIPGAFALGGGGTFGTTALLLALPVIALGSVRALLIEGSLLTAVGGRIGRALGGSPVVGPGAGTDAVGAILAALQVVALSAGALLLLSFLTVRGRDAFRSDDRSATEVLRTFGAVGLGVAAVGGAVTAISGATSFAAVGLNVLAAAVLLGVVDRTVPAGVRVTRPAILTPVVLVGVAHLLAAGGIFRGGILQAAYTGGLAVVTTVAVAITIERGGRAAAVALLLVAVSWWPSCLHPLPLGSGGC